MCTQQTRSCSSSQLQKAHHTSSVHPPFLLPSPPPTQEKREGPSCKKHRATEGNATCPNHHEKTLRRAQTPTRPPPPFFFARPAQNKARIGQSTAVPPTSLIFLGRKGRGRRTALYPRSPNTNTSSSLSTPRRVEHEAKNIRTCTADLVRASATKQADRRIVVFEKKMAWKSNLPTQRSPRALSGAHRCVHPSPPHEQKPGITP